MDLAFVAAETIAPTHAHRFAPESAAGNLLLGPGVALIDRVRDLLAGRDPRLSPWSAPEAPVAAGMLAAASGPVRAGASCDHRERPGSRRGLGTMIRG